MSEFDDALPHDGSDAEVPQTPEVPEESDQITVTKATAGKRKLVKEKPPKKKRSLARRITYWIIGLLTLSLLSYGGFYGYIIWKAEHNIRHSHALPRYTGMNDILIMGLDTRKDENNKPVDTTIYNALHLGDSDKGQNDSNVLMYIHIPKDGSKAVAISIPRDDWVTIPGCKSNVAGLPSATRMRYYVGSYCKGKIKSAYGWALAAAQDEGKTWQEAKDIARRAEILTVENFLHVKITGLVEVTMVAFFQMAEQIGKVQVCVKEATSDWYSGAKFRKGIQWINASQAVSFVRQRRDPKNLSFTDLDRSRRQQAFIVSLLTQLKSAGTLLNPIKLNGIVDVASNNVVLSDGLDVINAARLASSLSGGNLHFYTLPVVAFKDYQPSPGMPVQNANEVDVPKIQAIVQNLLHPTVATKPKPTPKPSASPTPLPSGAGYSVNIANASTVSRKAASVISELATRFHYTAGKASTASTTHTATTIQYNPADKSAAQTLAKRFNGAVTLVEKSSVASHTFDVTLGGALAKSTDPVVSANGKPSRSPTATKTPSKLPTAVSATGGGTNGPAITDLTDLGGGGIPCVK